MKNLFSGVKSPYFSNMATIAMLAILVTIFFASCDKGESAGGGSGPVLPPNPPVAVINMPTTPTFPLWNGESWAGNYSVTNAPSGAVLYINDTQVSMSGTVIRTNLSASALLRFELRKSNVDASVIAASSMTIPVFSNSWTLLQKDVKKWKNVYYGLLFPDGTYHSTTLFCAKRKFVATTAGFIGQVWIYNVPCGQGADGLATVTISPDEKFMTIEGEQWGISNILKLTSDTLELKSVDGSTWLKYVSEK